MPLNDGDNEGPLCATIKLSGGPSKFNYYHRGQKTFDTIINTIGCCPTTHKIACLRTVDFNTIYSAVQERPIFLSYDSTLVPWYPRADGTYLKDNSHRLLRTGKVTGIPYIIGDMKD